MSLARFVPNSKCHKKRSNAKFETIFFYVEVPIRTIGKWCEIPNTMKHERMARSRGGRPKSTFLEADISDRPKL